jgi:multiple sugar transport system permease protein
VASCVLWTQILNPDHGLINEFLRFLHLPEAWLPGWLADERWSKPGMVLMSVWGCGGGMVLYLAALQDVPQDLYESASIDGANAWHRLWHITIPMISPVLMFTLVMGLIGTMQYFTQAFVMTNGGPRESTTFYALKLFNSAFAEYRVGYASAMAWLMFAIILLATLGVVKLSNRYVYYHSSQRSHETQSLAHRPRHARFDRPVDRLRDAVHLDGEHVTEGRGQGADRADGRDSAGVVCDA